MKSILLALSLVLTSSQLFGQSPVCNTQQVHQFLVERGMASKADKGLVWCKPLLLDAKQNGFFAFGLTETDTFTYFLTKRGGQLFFIKERKIDPILNELSGYLKTSSFSFEEKSKCYSQVIKILEEEDKEASHWALPK
jgi:hypothetical protein